MRLVAQKMPVTGTNQGSERRSPKQLKHGGNLVCSPQYPLRGSAQLAQIADLPDGRVCYIANESFASGKSYRHEQDSRVLDAEGDPTCMFVTPSTRSENDDCRPCNDELLRGLTVVAPTVRYYAGETHRNSLSYAASEPRYMLPMS